MTAKEFVDALREVAAAYRTPASDSPAAREWAIVVAAWKAIKRRKTSAFVPAYPDPVLDLLARYDLAGVRLHQFEFVSKPHDYGRGLQLVAKQCMHDYYVCAGMVHVMYYKECEPNDSGVESAQFLDLLALRARMLVAEPMPSSVVEFDRIAAKYARQALAISPLAASFDFFGEERAAFEAGKTRSTNGHP